MLKFKVLVTILIKKKEITKIYLTIYCIQPRDPKYYHFDDM